jgi:hypothetical protein
MILLPRLAQAVSMVFFAGYGLGCFLSQRMAAEFTRYRAESVRPLTGALQLLASLGLFLGMWSPLALGVSSAGLALMMLVAIGIRIRIKDPLFSMLPAFFFFCLNSYLVARALITF